MNLEGIQDCIKEIEESPIHREPATNLERAKLLGIWEIAAQLAKINESLETVSRYATKMEQRR